MSTAEIIAVLARLSKAELAEVQAKVDELVASKPGDARGSIAGHPALGIWKDRADLPDDPVAASKLLRERMMRRSDSPA